MSIKEEVRLLKREHILAKAEQLFHERGYRATSLDAIAEALDMTKPFVYGAFDKKSDILAEIYRRIVNKTLHALDEAITMEASPTRRLHTFAILLTRVVIDNQSGVSVFFREEGSLDHDKANEINAMKSEFDLRLATLLDEGVQAGEFTIRDTRMASLAIGGLISWVFVWYRKNGRLDPETIAENMAEFVLMLVGAPTPNDMPGNEKRQ